MNNIDHENFEFRSTALEFAVAINDEGATAEAIVKDAEVFYGFLFPQNGKIQEVKPLCGERKGDAYIPPKPVVVDKPKVIEEPVKPILPEKKPARKSAAGLKGRKLDVLQTIVDLNRHKIYATSKEICDRTGIGGNNLPKVIKPLVQDGFIKVITVHGSTRKAYVALKDENGADPTGAVKDPMTGVTKCKAAYAEGYGMQKSQYEDL